MSWLQFCQDYRIQFKPGSKGENIQILCPFCGTAKDTSWHLGLHLKSPKWGCWEEKSHGSKSPLRLIMQLAGVDQEAARALANLYFETGWYAPVVDREEHKIPAVPTSFMQFKEYSSKMVQDMQKPFIKYLDKRKIDADWLGERYGVRWDASGQYCNRIVIPFIERETWRAWTARDIGNSGLRYKGSTGIPPGDFLLDIDNLQGGDVLLVVEGAFDAFAVKLCYLTGLDVTCLSGKRISDRQSNLLLDIHDRYNKIVICLDEAVFSSSLSEAYSLENYIPNVVARSPQNKDFGETERRELRYELDGMLRSVA